MKIPHNLDPLFLQNEQLLTAMCKLVKLGAWEYDLKTGNGVWSHELYRIMEFSPDQEPPRMEEYTNFLLKEYVPKLRESWTELMIEHKPFDIEVQLYTYGKKLIWVRALGEAVVNKGRCIKARGIFQDITESKNISQSLRHKNAQLHKMIKKVPGAVFRCVNNSYFDMEFISHQIYDISGYHPNEFSAVGDVKFTDIIKDIDQKRVGQTLKESSENGGEYEVQYRIITKNEDEKWVSEKGTFTENNKYIEGIITDIDERVRLEERILASCLQAEDNERKRLSKDLNDNVQQILTSSLFSFQALEDEITKHSPELQKHYKTGLSQLIKGLEESRLIAYNIMPMSIADFGLVNTLESMIGSFQNTNNLVVTLSENLKGKRLSEVVEVSLYRICQEAFSNIIRHAHATRVSIKLWRYKDILQFSIEDNGIGFDMKANPLYLSDGLGISYMKSRANSINGTIEISSMENVGTYVSVELPIEIIL